MSCAFHTTTTMKSNMHAGTTTVHAGTTTQGPEKVTSSCKISLAFTFISIDTDRRVLLLIFSHSCNGFVITKKLFHKMVDSCKK